MTTDWAYWKFSKFDAYCSKCDQAIPKDAPRWSRRLENGFYEHECMNCAPKPGNDDQQPQSSSREAAIAKAHEENMESAKQTRNAIAVLATAVNRLADVMSKGVS